jgi:polar amino acid transport system substrate-binding protein
MSRSALALALVLLATPASAAPAASGAHINFNSNAWPPYFVGDRGVAREVLELCLPATGFPPKFSAVSVEQMFPALQSGVLDGHVLSRSADRDRWVEFGSEEIFRDSYQPVIRRGSGIAVQTMRDLDKVRRLGHLSGVRYSPEYLDYVRKRREAGTLAEYNSNEEILQALLDGKIEAYVGLASSTRWLANERKVSERIQVLPLEIKTSVYYLALSRTSRRVQDRRKALAAFDACLAGLKRDGRYQQIRARYGLQ